MYNSTIFIARRRKAARAAREAALKAEAEKAACNKTGEVVKKTARKGGIKNDQ